MKHFAFILDYLARLSFIFFSFLSSCVPPAPSLRDISLKEKKGKTLVWTFGYHTSFLTLLEWDF